MNQSEFEVNACTLRQARENEGDQDTIGFALVSHWLRKCANFANQSLSEYKITLDTQWETALVLV